MDTYSTKVEIDSNKLRNDSLTWVESMRLKNSPYGKYKFCSNGHVTTMSSCFALFIRELLNDLENISDMDRQEWIDYLKSSQDQSTGLFYDPEYNRSDLKGKHNEEYFLHQNTMFCLSALNALDSKQNYQLSFLEKYKDDEYLITWLKSLNWSNPWLVSNNVMFIMYFLLFELETNNKSVNARYINIIFSYLDSIQDPETGYWGTNQGSSLFNGMAGAFHFYFSYMYCNRHIQYVEKIIDSTLALQHHDGLFSPAGGGGHCEDLDAIDILVKFSQLSSYRKIEVSNSLNRAIHALLANQNLDGGFCYAKLYRYSLSDWKKSIRHLYNEKNIQLKDKFLLLSIQVGKQALLPFIKEYRWNYSSWNLMNCKINESDMWSTWFRLLAIALIDSSDGNGKNIDWVFRKQAVLGWHNELIGMNSLDR